uniref:Uncharacterized protein n=1 Tax=Quercus lobata TaxID=97700 RepID=A0A7N2LKP4_QUELO
MSFLFSQPPPSPNSFLFLQSSKAVGTGFVELANRSSKKMLRVAARKLSSLSSTPWRPNQVQALVSRHFINGGDSSSSGDPRSNGSA